MSARGRIIKLEPQPDYPVEDVSPNNVEMLGGFWLINRPGIDAQTKILAKHQRAVFSMAVTALGMKKIKIEDAPAEYVGFRRGFAAVEFMTTLLHSARDDWDTSVRSAQIMFRDGDFFDANSLAERRDKWMENYPNTCEVMFSAGTALGESMTQLQARAVGAQIALELHDPLLAA